MIPSAMANAPRQMSAREWALLLFLSVLWGGSFLFIRIAVEEIGPFQLVFLRTACGAAALLAALRITGLHLPRTLNEWGPFFVIGFINNIVPFSLLFWGEQFIPAGLAAILNAGTPIFAVVLARCWGPRERITPGRLLGVALGIAGVCVLIGSGALLQGFGPQTLWAEAAIVAASAAYALAGMYGRRFAALPSLVTATGQIAAAALMALPLMLLLDPPHLPLAWPSLRLIVAIGWLGLLSTALAYILYFHLLARAGPTNVTLVTLLAPATAVLLGWLVLGEMLLPQHWAGMALIGAGLIAIDGRLKRVSKTPPLNTRV